MNDHKQEKFVNLIKELSAEFLQRESNGMSMITVTGADVSPDGAKAVILITVLPEDMEKNALEFVSRKGGELRDFVKAKARLRKLPFFTFALDYGEKNRLKLESLS